MHSVNRSLFFVTNITSSFSSQAEALLWTSPGAAVPYILILGVIAVIGTLGNVMIVGTLTCGRRVGDWKKGSSVRYRIGGGDQSRVYSVGNLFITNLACSDLIVTAIINPFAILGKSVTRAVKLLLHPYSV